MKKNLAYALVAGALLAPLPFASQAEAGTACGAYRGWFTAPVRPAPCSYQGPYMVEQGPYYDGPAVIAPQPTYSPSRNVAAYVPGPYSAAPVADVAPVRYRRNVEKKSTRVSVKGDAPARKGKVQVVKARAEVRIYGPERMEIKLYRGR